MTLSPKEALVLQRDSDSDDLLWASIRRFMSLMLLNPAKLGEQLGLAGAYAPTAKETQLATEEARSPGRYRAQILSLVYDNLDSVLPDATSASEVMAGLRDGSLAPTVFAAFAAFAPGLAAVLVPDPEVV